MDFHFSEEQRMLRESAREFLQAECPKTFVREMEKDPKGYTPELWGKMANLGWMGIVFWTFWFCWRRWVELVCLGLFSPRSYSEVFPSSRQVANPKKMNF